MSICFHKFSNIPGEAGSRSEKKNDDMHTNNPQKNAWDHKFWGVSVAFVLLGKNYYFNYYLPSEKEILSIKMARLLQRDIKLEVDQLEKLYAQIKEGKEKERAELWTEVFTIVIFSFRHESHQHRISFHHSHFFLSLSFLLHFIQLCCNNLIDHFETRSIQSGVRNRLRKYENLEMSCNIILSVDFVNIIIIFLQRYTTPCYT